MGVDQMKMLTRRNESVQVFPEARRLIRERMRNNTQEAWINKIHIQNNNEAGSYTRDLLRDDLVRWMERMHGSVDFHLTQVFTGHGSFGKYLHKIRKWDEPYCPYCNVEGTLDDVHHILFECAAWSRQRLLLAQIPLPCEPGGNHLRGVIREMLSSKDKWLEYSKEIHNIMLEKKELERERERELAVLQEINSGA